MKWLANIPYMLLVPLALFLALAPFTPEPHLWQKLRMLANGTLSGNRDAPAASARAGGAVG